MRRLLPLLIAASLLVVLVLAGLLLDARGARASEQPLSRAQVVRHAMPRSVRIQLVVDGEVRRSASGVVVQSELGRDGGKGRAEVLTNAHVADPGELEHVTYRVLLESHGRVEKTLEAKAIAIGHVPETDLALLEVNEALPVAELGEEQGIDVGDEVVVVGAPYGRSLSVSGGMVSQLEAEEGGAPESLRFKAMKTDAAIGYGSSGGGVFTVPGGRLVGIVEGYRTARVAISDQMSFDVPMPGETFVAPITKVRRFLVEHLKGFGEPPAALAAAAAKPPAQTVAMPTQGK